MTTRPTFSYGSPFNPPLDYVFHELVEVVQNLIRDGRSTRSAGVKPRLTQRLGTPLDERSYGFATFREFLNAAREAGVIALRSAESGPDVDVLPVDRYSEDEAKPRTPTQLRPDLWSTFMDWTPGFLRAYDREEGKAFRVAIAAEAHDLQIRQLRQAMQTDRRRFVPITPVDLQTQTGWAHSFVTGLSSGGDRDLLAQALRGERPLQAFTHIIRTLAIQRDWKSFRNEQVVETIRSWARQNDLTIDPRVADDAPSSPTAVATPPRRRVTTGSAVQPRAAAESDLGALRRRAHELIDQMTAEELLALPLTLGMLYRR
ncbi:UPF0158 family protein [Actinomadura sp. 6N118]|uniref:UPF0158 family protein n=1 Tax=Actinomadura sp. 6N118 TaxID=3375151 RepID=UPI0037A21D86